MGDLVTGTVLQGTPDFTIIKIRDGVEAELPHYDLKRFPNERNERPNNEHYRHNQRLKVLIIDVRDNGGGNLTTAQRLAGRFTNEKVLVGYMTHKTGPGHNDFSDPAPVYLESSTGIRWQKKAVVLTNRRSFSATNDFVNCMRQLPLVTIVGDKTGGGSGLPFSSEIPNGWSIRFSASPMYDTDMNQLEFGIDPDIKVDMTSEDMQRGKDTMIEKACEILKN